MRQLLVVWGLIVTFAVVSTAAQFDMAAIMKWKDAKVVHYQIVGVFRASTPLGPEKKTAGQAFVEATDKVTVEFDWDVRANAVVGQTKFTNAPTQVISANSGKANCPPPSIKGTYEHLDVKAIEPGPAGLSLKGTRAFPAAGVSSEWPATCAQQQIAASTEDVSEVLAVTSPILALMPSGANPNLIAAPDRKSYTLKVQGWNWTYTPSIVK
jgi:hypothetical protein